MCRHMAYLGRPEPLRSLLLDPPHGLYRQAWAPRLQRHGTVNADGFGIGWYADGDPVPARYRRAVPIWGDPSLPDLARVTRSGAVLAAVRSATTGMALGEAAAAPFAVGGWLFSHNGVLAGWPGSAAAVLAAVSRPPDALPGRATGTPISCLEEPETPPEQAATVPGLLSLEAMTDSAFLWAMVLERLRAGAEMVAALAATIGTVEASGGTGRFNFLITDGETVAATACGDTLWYRLDPGGVTVASEPGDDEPGWTEVPNRHALAGSPAGVTICPLTDVAQAAGAVPAR